MTNEAVDVALPRAEEEADVVGGPPELVVAVVTTDQDGRCCHYSYHRFGEVFSSRVYMMSSALHCTAQLCTDHFIRLGETCQT